jgi:tyrosyl-tRNA synthetase
MRWQAGKAPGSEINEAKKVLADAATAMLHGHDSAREAAETARKTFEQGSAGDALPTLKVDGQSASSMALTALGFARRTARPGARSLKGAVRLNGVAITDPSFAITLEEGEPLKLSLGKKRHGILTC